MNLAFMINPLAGYGGKINRKGSDGLILPSIGESVSLARAIEFLKKLKTESLNFLVPAGPMGAETLDRAGVSNYRIIFNPGNPTTSEDTKGFAAAAATEGADIFLFVGGDGTARDILSVLGKDIPVMGIPAGVKMYSSVFAINVDRAAEFINSIAPAGSFATENGEVVDIDEEQYREGRLVSKLYGDILIPVNENVIGVSKAEYHNSGKEGIAEYVIEKMDKGTYYIIGPGSTCKFILGELGIRTNILGFDVLREKDLVAEDASEQDIFRYASEGPSCLVVSPIGGQGFVLGRGNKQISPRVLKAIGMENIIVVSTHEKLAELKKLYLDMDERESLSIPSYIKVLYGYGRYRIVPVLI